jgi:N-glycosylase/DNA lyase
MNGNVNERSANSGIVWMEFKSKSPIDLQQTFECGQCFRWSQNDDGSYSGVVDGEYVTVRHPASAGSAAQDLIAVCAAGDSAQSAKTDSQNDHLCTHDEAFWRAYLDLDRDYAAIQRKIARGDAVMKAAIKTSPHIHILKQDKWETLVSFIISQNNNIKRISHCIEILCEHFGTYIGQYDSKPRFAFPTPEQIVQGGSLNICHLGYREDYLNDVARAVCALGGTDGMPQAAGKEAHEWLLSLKGVGPKVAACIELFAYADFTVFPIDVWMRRAMHKLYDIDESDIKAMQAYAAAHFGAFAGLAQQYLFSYMRMMG